MRRLSIRHATRYRYAAPVEFGPHKLLVRPREGHDIRIDSSLLAITPAHAVQWHRDVYGNSVAVVTFTEPADALEIVSEVGISHYEDAPIAFPLEPYAETFPFQYQPQERMDLAPFQNPLFAKETDALKAWADPFWKPGDTAGTFELLESINAAIPERFAYARREEPGVQRPAETLASGQGSCRDFATLFIETCRHLGLAARFVSGYLHAPGLAAAEGATHAWSEVYLPGAGWRGFDSTIGRMVGGDHIAVAVSRHPETVPPITGAFSGELSAPPTMEVEVEVSVV